MFTSAIHKLSMLPSSLKLGLPPVEADEPPPTPPPVICYRAITGDAYALAALRGDGMTFDLKTKSISSNQTVNPHS